jgi:hypothetical protein
MPEIQYKLFFGDKVATQEQLDRVEEITAEQEQDVAWGVSLKVPICTDEKGNWSGEDEKFMASFSRVRVEIKVGDGDFTPLIDGPVIGADTSMSPEPGKSFITLRVQDDSAYLNRADSIQRFDGMLDHEIADRLFDGVKQIAEKQIETTPKATGNSTPSVVQRGTEIQLLRSLADRQGMHAYVLPGTSPGKSIGCFKKLPVKVGGLPNMILLGADRNVAEFTVLKDAQAPAKVTAYAVNATDKSVAKQTASVQDLEPVGKEVSLVKEDDVAVHVAPPRHGDAVDLEQFVRGLVERYAFGLEATGKILGECYSGVISPYQYVTVIGVNSRLSGDYLITKVTHTLSRGAYGQAFTAKRKALSEGAASGLADLIASIF